MRIKKVFVQNYNIFKKEAELEEINCFYDDLFYYSFNEQVEKWAAIDKNNGMVVMWGDDISKLIESTRSKIDDYYLIKQTNEYKNSVNIYHKLLLKNANKNDLNTKNFNTNYNNLIEDTGINFPQKDKILTLFPI